MSTYPIYAKTPKHLIKIGATRLGGGEYRHSIPLYTIDILVDAILEKGAGGIPVKAAHLSSLSTPKGNHITSSYMYETLGWMQRIGVVTRDGYKGYQISKRPDEAISLCKAELARLPDLMEIRPPAFAPSPQAASLERLIRRQNRRLKEIQNSLEALADLLLSTTPPLPSATTFPLPQPAAMRPLVAVAGVRRHQRQAILDRLRDVAVVEFVEAERTGPESLGDFDRVYCVQCTSSAWKRRAKHALGTKFQEHRGTSLIVEAIERLAGTSV